MNIKHTQQSQETSIAIAFNFSCFIQVMFSFLLLITIFHVINAVVTWV